MSWYMYYDEEGEDLYGGYPDGWYGGDADFEAGGEFAAEGDDASNWVPPQLAAQPLMQPCLNGPSCRFLAMGICRFAHSDEDWERVHLVAPPDAAAAAAASSSGPASAGGELKAHASSKSVPTPVRTEPRDEAPSQGQDVAPAKPTPEAPARPLFVPPQPAPTAEEYRPVLRSRSPRRRPQPAPSADECRRTRPVLRSRSPRRHPIGSEYGRRQCEQRKRRSSSRSCCRRSASQSSSRSSSSSRRSTSTSKSQLRHRPPPGRLVAVDETRFDASNANGFKPSSVEVLEPPPGMW